MLSLTNSLAVAGVGVPRLALCAAAAHLPELLRSVSTTTAAEAQRRVTTPKRVADSDLWKPAPARKMSAEAKELHYRLRAANFGRLSGPPAQFSNPCMPPEVHPHAAFAHVHNESAPVMGLAATQLAASKLS
ncbi:hypothetical protein ABPG75_013993 [Micractinium tetrahymenae]